ncbi:PQQ-dependent sugar dehydrogenase [Nocardioides dubius]|uniref:PQQ-dependent sugar dehydrogenase n=1 Tax=Nocardioides dubius TaxID=317019 RepID=A0ABN1TMC0_9ACTN
MRRRAAALTASVLVLTLPAALPAAAEPPPRAAGPADVGLIVTTAVSGLAQPWDVQPLGSGHRLIVSERDNRRLVVSDGLTSTTVRFPRGAIWAAGETGLMSVVRDVRFARNNRIYTCHGHRSGTTRDVRVVAWRLDLARKRMVRIKNLVTGIPATTGRHGGCRLLIARSGALLVGTGDAAQSRNPQRLTSLGGKVLRLNRYTGRPWPSNPWIKAKSRTKRLVLTYGHRNVQGLAQRKDGTVWSVEHGSYRDDEVNRLRKGGNYGWAPGPGYDESVPMTDHRLPGRQISARWRSGTPTLATSGAAWVRGERWGALNGTLAVAALKGERVVFMRFDRRGKLRWTYAPPALRGFGRLRSVTVDLNGDLLVTTANGSDDRVLRVSTAAD